MKKHFSIAIDGPGGAGKSTLAKAVAKKLNILHVDTGAIYRTIGYAAFSRGLDAKDESQIAPLLKEIQIDMAFDENSGQKMLLCPNHSTDLDPVLIGLCLPLDYHLHFMAKAELFDNRALAWLIRTLGAFPVQRDGKDIQSIKTAMQVLHKGENLLIFPEGTTIRGGVGYHDGLPAHAHAGIAMIGVRTGATLVPVFCDGQKKPFHKTRIIFGEPYVPEVTGRRGTSEELQAIADEMLRQAYALGGQQVGGAPL